MPELPEVQTVVNDLALAGLPGMRITEARVFWPRTIATPDPESFCRQIKGRKILRIWRRAKYIIVDLDDDRHLLIHLRMSGRLHLVPPSAERGKHEHVIFVLDTHQHVRFHDTRKFGRMYLVRECDEILGKLGPEPLDASFTTDVLAKRLQGRKRQLKPLLLDQTFLAGLGNIYVDEALWNAHLHPQRQAASLCEAEVIALYQAIRATLRRGIENSGTSLGNGKANFSSVSQQQGQNREQLQVFRRTGRPCPRCATPIERILVGQRSTHICPHCQKLTSS